MGGSRKDRREQERLESKALRRALPLIKDNPVRAAVRTRYAVSLAGGSAPEAVLAGAHREADAFGAKIFAGSGAPACAAGCSHCCEHVNVGVNAVEARALASHLRQLPPAALEAVRQRISANATRAREASPGTYPRMPCALLGEDRRCTVYEHRPFVCRRATRRSHDPASRPLRLRPRSARRALPPGPLSRARVVPCGHRARRAPPALPQPSLRLLLGPDQAQGPPAPHRAGR